METPNRILHTVVASLAAAAFFIFTACTAAPQADIYTTTATADRLLKLNGGKPVMSQLESIQQAGYSNDAQGTLKQIQDEEATASQSRISNIFEESSI